MYKFLQGRLIHVRLTLLAAAAVLVVIGIITIYAVGNPAEDSPASKAALFSEFWKKQLVFAGLGALAFVAVNLVSYRRLGEVSYWIFAAVLFLLLVLLLGKVIDLPFVPMINGTHRWIVFTIAGRQLPAIQPSELCKLAYILALTWYLRYRSNYRSLKALIGPFLITLIPIVLILLEPDLGTVMLMMPVLLVMVFVAGARIKHLLLVALLAVLVSPLFWAVMRPYQKMRIVSVLLQSPKVQQYAQDHPGLSKLVLGTPFNKRSWSVGYGFHLTRSKYAIASGGKTGRGFRQGPFIKYSQFLPESHNDFIFAVIAHQWGFYGALGVLFFYAIIFICGLEIAHRNTDPFGRLLALGITAMFTIEVLVNVSMTLGLMPITGLTLPLVSYGGSSLLTSTLAIGLLNNVGRARPFSVAPPKI
jgi:cell division protein FtsW (lipid II flippase)